MDRIMLILKLVFLTLIVFTDSLPSDKLSNTQIQSLNLRNVPQIQRRTGIIRDIFSRIAEPSDLVRSILRERLEAERSGKRGTSSLLGMGSDSNNDDEVRFLRRLVVTLNNKNKETSASSNPLPILIPSQSQIPIQNQPANEDKDDFRLKVIKMLFGGSNERIRDKQSNKAVDRAKLLRVMLDELGQSPSSDSADYLL